MPKTTSKKSVKAKSAKTNSAKAKSVKPVKSTPKKPAKAKSETRFKHKSFKRSYREDYDRPFEAPGLLAHAVASFKIIFKNWKLFLPLVLLIAILNIALVGLMNEDTFVAFQKSVDETTEGVKNGQIGTFAKSGLLLVSTITTGGLATGSSEASQIFSFLLALVAWLVVIYLLRHLLTSKEPIKLRDALYNALAPFLSTIVVAAVIFIEAIPIMVVIISYAAAVKTNFLSTPFYALLFVIFAALLILLSVYLISSSLIALVAVSAPGLYPMQAIKSASNLLAGRRIKFIIRVFYLIIVVGVLWAVIMTPLIAIDIGLKSSLEWLKGFPFVSIELLLMTCFTEVYATTYLYLFYRRLLDYED